MNHHETWHKICDYYYDNVHWETTNNKIRGIVSWLKNEHGAAFNAETLEFIFDDDKQKSWFILRWS
jgi:hypothetical protein